MNKTLTAATTRVKVTGRLLGIPITEIFDIPIAQKGKITTNKIINEALCLYQAKHPSISSWGVTIL